MSVNPFASYVVAKVGNIPKAKLERALKGLTVRLTNAELSGDRVMLMHPLNARAVKRAQAAGKGLATNFTAHEALADLHHHERAGGNLNGGSLWSWLKNKAYPWVKEHWGIIKPIVGKLADVAIPAVATAVGAPEAGVPARLALKGLTGVGTRKARLVKGSEEAREHMRKLRERRKGMAGSSFRMP